MVGGVLDELRVPESGLLMIGARRPPTMRRWSDLLWEDVGAGLAWRAQCSVLMTCSALG